MSKRGEWLAGVVLAAFGVLFALATLELGVRMLHLVPDRFWEADPQRGIRLAAGRSGWWSQEDREFLVPVTINRRGLRDVEHELEKPAGRTRVLLVGDSFVEALHVPLDAAVGRQLEAALNQALPAPRFEVISAGVSGYGTAAELLFWEADLRAYRPDVVVVAFYVGNDVKNNSPTLEDYLQPQYDPAGALQRIDNKQKVPAAPRSKAFHYFRQLLLRRQPALAQRLAAWGLLPSQAVRQAPQRDGIAVDYGVYTAFPDAAWQDAWERSTRLLDQMRRSVEDTGARFVVAIVAPRDQIYPEIWAEIVRQTPAMQNMAWDLDGASRRAEAWCHERGAHCVALASRFRAVAQSGGEALHYRQDGHWTPAGHKLAAGVIAEYLHDMGS